MAFSTKTRDRILGMLLPLGPVVARSMFGCCGLNLDGVMFGLIADDTLYLKTDERSRPRFEAAGMPPFSYETESGRNIIMSYSEVPPEAMMDPAELVDWAEGAVAAARRSRAGKAKHAVKRRPVKRQSVKRRSVKRQSVRRPSG